jgi:hypothetical protein
VLAVVFLLAVAAEAGEPGKISKEKISFKGTERIYFLFVPARIAPEHKVPLLVTLHGSGQNAENYVLALRDLAEKEKVVIVGPASNDSIHWTSPEDGPLLARFSRASEESPAKQPRFAGPFDDVFAGFVLDPGFDFQAMPGAIDGAHHEMRGHGVADVDRKEKPDRLRPIDCAGPRQQHAHHRREDRRRQHSVNDAAAELRSRRELVVDVKRIRVPGDLDEPLHVFVREGLTEAGRLPGLEVFDPRDD